MRKIVVGMLLSLDGVAEAPDRFFGWDDALDASVPRLIATQDAVILGRHRYDEWVGFWPGSEIEPFATFINGVTKYVATSTPLDRDWANATVLGRRPSGQRHAPDVGPVVCEWQTEAARVRGRDMSQLPTGTVTFLFTDVEGSTRLLSEAADADAYRTLLEDHRRPTLQCHPTWRAPQTGARK